MKKWQRLFGLPAKGLIRGVFSEPPKISTLVWNTGASGSGDGKHRCERLHFLATDCPSLNGATVRETDGPSVIEGERSGGSASVAAVSRPMFSMYCTMKGIAGMDREKSRR